LTLNVWLTIDIYFYVYIHAQSVAEVLPDISFTRSHWISW